MSFFAPPLRSGLRVLLETLEDRIAPAVILAGPVSDGGQEYTSAGTPFVPASQVPLQAGDPQIFPDADTSHFYLDLKAGDTLRVFNGGAFNDWVQVTGGRAYAFFFDRNADSIPQVDELSGLSLSAGARVVVTGSVDGDILGTLAPAANNLPAPLSTNDLIGTGQTITSLQVSGSVQGNIVAGGSLSAITVGGSVHSVQSGTGSDLAFNFGGTGAAPGVGQGLLSTFTPQPGQVGGSLNNISVGAAQSILGGVGGAGAAGGAVNNVTVTADHDGILIRGGAGGDGISGRLAGGAGGRVSQVVLAGPAGGTDEIGIFGGLGGNAFAGSNGAGGAGGAVDRVWVGYEYNSARQIVQSSSLLSNPIVVSGADGGAGAAGGAGGAVSAVTIAAAPTDDPTPGTHEISLLGGDGGDLFSNSTRAGAGGSVSNFKILNFDLGGTASSVFVKGGDASSPDGTLPPAPGAGAAGGSISNPAPRAGDVWLVGRAFEIFGGQGSNTTNGGGAGGSITNLAFSTLSGVFLRSATISGGFGGNALTGSGGAGGDITGVTAPSTFPDKFDLRAGQGGVSAGNGVTGGLGGRGGSVSNLSLSFLDGPTRSMSVEAGPGGNGFAGGGAGGSIRNLTAQGDFAVFTVQAGQGGTPLVRGNGGAGGSITTASLTAAADITAGAGGKGAAGGSITGLTVTRANDIRAGSGGEGGAGGSIQNLQAGDVSRVLAGAGGERGAGGAITNASVNTFLEMRAGDGGAGRPGGNLTNITVFADADGLILAAGRGGDGNSSLINGGAGGRVSQVVIFGASGTQQVAGQNPEILIQAGRGGDAFAGSRGSGAAGGALETIWVGYEYNSSRQIVESPAVLATDIVLRAGNGGGGAVAGAGGAARNINVIGAPPDDGGAYEIVLASGAGGTLSGDSTRAGAGGLISSFKIKNLHVFPPDPSDVLVQAGAASAAGLPVPAAGSGAAGGSISNPVARSGEQWLIGSSFTFEAGAGSNTAASGGVGGSITNLYFQPFSPVFLSQLLVTAGQGGVSTVGAGGAGGSVSGIFVPISDLQTFEVRGGAGGASLGDTTRGAAGGRGGNVATVQVFDAEILGGNPTRVQALFAAGQGGDGWRGGSAGGNVSDLTFFAAYASLNVRAGDGGAASGTIAASGGAGGAVTGVAFASERIAVGLLPQTAAITAGQGGAAVASGVGGNGGTITRINAQTIDGVSLKAGDGGVAGDRGRTGAGGAVGSAQSASGIFAAARAGDVSFVAGHAGAAVPFTAPTSGGAGGGVTNAVASAGLAVTFEGGRGQLGGAGGSLSGLSFYGGAGVASLPAGLVTLTAGAGGDAASATATAGAGGSITNASGYTSANPTLTSVIQAGQGGTNGGRGGAGGSITGLTIFADPRPVTIVPLPPPAGISVVAGHGGDGSTAGGLGGSVTRFNSAGTINVFAVAAGDGGSVTAGTGRGANGGSINTVNVGSDIGVRTGAAYGFATDGSAMGGVFAGRGGLNANQPSELRLTGQSGDVTNVTARAISAIVAGRGDSPWLVNRVDGLFLSGNTPALLQAGGGGAFANFGTANLVGGKAGDPSLPGASDYQFVGGSFAPSGTQARPWTYVQQSSTPTEPVDGLIAALNLTTRRNVMPLAFLTNTAAANQPPVYQMFVPTVPVAP